LCKLLFEEEHHNTYKPLATKEKLTPKLVGGEVPKLSKKKMHCILPAFEGEEMAFVRDLVKYVFYYGYDVVMLQEVYSEQIYLHLCTMLKEIRFTAHCHYGECRYQDWCSNNFRCTGLVVFSRWPLLSVRIHQFDSILSRNQLGFPLPIGIRQVFSDLTQCF